MSNDIRALIKLSYVCNNSCLFCHRGSIRGQEKLFSLEEKIKEAKELGVTTIELSGGEPTIQKNIIDTLSAINREKIKSGLISNGRMFSYKHFFEKIIALNVNFFFISLHSHNPEKHDFLTGTKKSWEQTVKGIENIIKHKSKPQLIVNCVVVNENINELEDFVLFLKKKKIKNIKFSFPFLMGEMEKNKKLMSSINLAKEKISDALLFCEKNKIKGFYEGLPFCQINKKYRFNVHSLERARIYYIFEPVKGSFKSIRTFKNNKKINCLECSYYSSCGDYFLGNIPIKTSPIYEKIPGRIVFCKSRKNHPNAIFIEEEGFYKSKGDFFMVKDIEQVKKTGNIFYFKKDKLYFLKKRIKGDFFKSEESFYEKLEEKIKKTIIQLKGKGLLITSNNLYKEKVSKKCIILKEIKDEKICQNYDSLDYIVLGESYNQIKYLGEKVNLFKNLLKNGGKLIIFERNLFGILEDDRREKKANYRNHSINMCVPFLKELGFKINKKNDYKNLWEIVAEK
jgi:MoaA/NifB/PqqE/SkfB family radical SAM enzyme